MTESAKPKKKILSTTKGKKALFINFFLLVFGILVVFTGFVLLLKFHMGREGEISTTDKFLELNFSAWSNTHIVLVLFFTFFSIYHISLHWKWFTQVIERHLIAKKKEMIWMSVFFILVAITGYIPLITHLSGSSEIFRGHIIEIHDKFALILTIFLIRHVMKRFKWLTNNLKILLSN